MSVSARIQSKITITETLTGAFISSSDATFAINGMDADYTINATSTIPATKATGYEIPLSTGAVTINLAALTGPAGETLDATGLKVQAVKFTNKSTNANKITITKGASSGLGFAADGSTFTVPLSPGQSVQFEGVDANPDVAGGARQWDVTGTGSQVLQMTIVVG